MEDAVFLHGGRLGHVFYCSPPPTFALLFLFPQKITSLLLLAGRAWIPRKNVLETIETSGIETIQIYLESPGGALCNVLSYVFTRKVLKCYSIVTEDSKKNPLELLEDTTSKPPVSLNHRLFLVLANPHNDDEAGSVHHPLHPHPWIRIPG